MTKKRSAEEYDIIVSRWLETPAGQEWLHGVLQEEYDKGYKAGVADVDCQQARDEAWQEARYQYG